MRSPKLATRAIRRRKAACDAYANGATLSEAAKVAGYADHSGARLAILRACADASEKSGQQVVTELKRQADELCLLLWRRLEDPDASHKDVESLGRTLLGAWARIATMLGLDAAHRSELKVTTELPDDVAALKERLAKLLEKVNGEATADRDPCDGAGGPAPGPGLVGQDEPRG